MVDKILTYLKEIFPKTATIDQIVEHVEGERKEILFAFNEIKGVCISNSNGTRWGLRSSYVSNPVKDIAEYDGLRPHYQRPKNDKPVLPRHKRPKARLVSGGIPGSGRKS